MTYLLIFFVIALALAPLSHFVPSKRQRRIANLREYAAIEGLFVEFRGLPGADKNRERPVIAPRGDIIYYGKRLRPRRTGAVQSASWIYSAQGWRSLGQRTLVPDQLLQLPENILAASVQESSCGIYWQETGEQEQVGQIKQALESWAASLLQ